MKKLILGIITGGIIGAVLILVIITLSRKGNGRQDGLQLVSNDSAAAHEPKKQQVLVYGEYMDLDSTDFLLIPLGMKTLSNQVDVGLRSKSSEEFYDSYAGGYRSYKYNFYRMDFSNCNNIIFYDKRSESTHLLLERPAIISQFYFPFYNKEYVGEKYYFILLGIVEDDSNADGYLNSEDAEKVYLSDLSGKKMTQITPDNTQLVDWFIDPATNHILMKVRFDSNKDLKFNYYDDIEILKTSIDSPELGKQIIGKDIKNNIQKILKKIK